MKKNLCALCLTASGLLAALALLGLSFLAISHVGSTWTPLDYWLIWFSVATFVAGIVALIFGVVMCINLADLLCGERRS